MPFSLDLAGPPDRPVLRVRGELDIATAPRLAEAVAAQLAAAPALLTVALDDTTFLDSSGARELASAARRADSAGVPLHVVCPLDNGPVRRVLELLQLHAVVPIRASVESAEPEAGP